MKEKNYKSLDEFYKKKFGFKVCKVSLDAGFDCPNKDGSKGFGGCIFCNGSIGIGDKDLSLKEQFMQVKDTLYKKWPNAKFIPFLEANTNTYADVKELRKIYEELLDFDDVVGLCISTRCDAFTGEIYDLLEEINQKTYLSIELGLQSSFDETLKFLNRGHTVDEFTSCVRELRRRKIDVVVHVINGLPYETEEMMIETIKYVNSLNVQGIKFHMLFIEEETALAELYDREHFTLLSQEEYVRILGKQLEMLDKEVVVHRLLSGPDNKKLIEPKWLVGKFKNLNYIEMFLRDHNIKQGQKK